MENQKGREAQAKKHVAALCSSRAGGLAFATHQRRESIQKRATHKGAASPVDLAQREAIQPARHVTATRIGAGVPNFYRLIARTGAILHRPFHAGCGVYTRGYVGTGRHSTTGNCIDSPVVG